jgi:hypothetical protein
VGYLRNRIGVGMQEEGNEMDRMRLVTRFGSHRRESWCRISGWLSKTMAQHMGKEKCGIWYITTVHTVISFVLIYTSSTWFEHERGEVHAHAAHRHGGQSSTVRVGVRRVIEKAACWWC